MDEHSIEDGTSIERLNNRVRYLEELNQWMLEAFESVAHTGEFNAATKWEDSANIIFDSTRLQLRRFFSFDTIAFLRVDNSLSEFVVDQIDPPEERPALESEINKLIDDGSFGLSVLQKRAITFSSQNDAHLIVVHTLATRTGIFGMFVGLMKDAGSAPNEVMLNILSILLFKTAAALEQRELYRRITEQNKFLEQNIDERTNELQQALERQKHIEQQLRATIEKMEAAIEREQAAQIAIVRSEQRYRHIFETVQDVLFETDWERRLLDITPSAERLSGYTREELIGKNISFVYSDENDKERLTQLLNQNGEVTDYEVLLNVKHNRQLWFSLNATIMKDQNGVPTGLRGSLRDITTRKFAELSLQRSEAQLAEAQAIAHIGSWYWVVGSEEVRLSDEMYRIYGLEPQVRPFMLHDVWNAVRSEEREVFVNFIKHHITQNQSFKYPIVRITRPSGEIRWLEVSGNITIDKSGRREVTGVVRDITEQRKIDEVLRTSEKKYRTVVESVKEVIFQVGLDHRWIFLNPAWADITGFALDESLGQECTMYIHQDDRYRSMQLFQSVIEKQKDSCRQEIRFIHKDGSFRWIEVNAQPFQDENDRMVGIAGTLMDITNRRNAEEELRKAKEELEIRVEERTSELQYTVGQLNVELNERKLAEDRIREQAALLDKAHDAISVRDLDGRIRYWNKGAERLYECTAEEVLHHSINELNDSNAALFDQAMQQTLLHGEWNGEFIWKQKDRRKCIVESRWTLVRNTAGDPQSVLVIDADVSEKKELQNQFLRTQRMESLGTLAGGIAHDLNNVLTPILMWIEVLRHKLPNPEMQRILELLESSAKRGAGIVQQVLSFSRGVSGERVEVQLRHLVAEMGKIIRETFPKSIELYSDYPKDLWTIVGDATQLHQVLLNLCVNARDAMQQGGRLSIDCRNLFVDEHYSRMHLDAQPGPYVVLSVVDTGTGIPQDLLDRIFEPFFTTKELGKGTGLGLSTTIAIVKGHGGFINVYSEPGKGTSFKVYLPATPNSIGSTVEEHRSELIPGKNELILVVDDESIIRDAAKAILEQYGYRVLLAEDGAQAVALYTSHQSDISVVFVDMMMPIMDGLSTIRALQHLNPTIKIIAASGLADNERSVQARKMNIHGFIHKPFAARDMLKLLSTVISGQPANNGSL